MSETGLSPTREDLVAAAERVYETLVAIAEEGTIDFRFVADDIRLLLAHVRSLL